MKLIDKYLLRTFLAPLAYCLLAFGMVYVIYDLFDNLGDFVEGKTPLLQVLQYYLVLMPSVLTRIVPICLLLAALYALSSLTKNNEITAMRASGISISRLIRPFLLVGLFASLAVAAVHESIGPRASYWCYNFVKEQKKADPDAVYVKNQLAIKNQGERRIWLINEFDIRTYDMRGIELTQQREDLSDEWKIRAKEARWLDGRWWLKDVIEQRYDVESNPLGPPRFLLNREMSDLTEDPVFFLNDIKDPEFLSSAEIVRYLETHQQRDPAALTRIRVDLHYRLAEPWTCLVVTLLGIPFGIQTGRRGAFLGVALSIGLFFTYYVVIHLGLSLGKNGMVPAIVAGWLPNALFLATGSVLTHRMR